MKLPKKDSVPVTSSRDKVTSYNKSSEDPEDLAYNDLQFQGNICVNPLVPRQLKLIKRLEQKVIRLVKNVAKANAGIQHLKCENTKLRDKHGSVIEQTKQENVKTNVTQSYSGMVKRKPAVRNKGKVGAKSGTRKAADRDLSAVKLMEAPIDPSLDLCLLDREEHETVGEWKMAK